MFAFVLGTKAELIKCAPVMKEFEKRGIAYFFIHTGQHSLGDIISDFKLKRPDFVLYEPPKLSSRFMTKTRKALFWGLPLIFKIRKLLVRLKPKYVLYHGDTLSAATAAIATKLCKGPESVHLEAGLRSGSILEPFPEEISRQICDRFSDVLFAVSNLTESNLRKEKHRGKIIKVGNTIIDSVKICLGIYKYKRKYYPNSYVLVNIHRHENIKSVDRLTKIVQIIEKINYPVVWPIHDNTKKQLIKFGLWNTLQKLNVHFSPLCPYIEFIQLLANSKYLVTDGGSIQEESLALKKPCILLRKRTERIEGLSTGINFLTNLDVENTVQLIKRIEQGIKVKNFENPYGNGGASAKIVDFLIR